MARCDRLQALALGSADVVAAALVVALTFPLDDTEGAGWQVLLVVPAVPVLLKAMGLYDHTR